MHANTPNSTDLLPDGLRWYGLGVGVPLLYRLLPNDLFRASGALGRPLLLLLRLPVWVALLILMVVSAGPLAAADAGSGEGGGEARASSRLWPANLLVGGDFESAESIGPEVRTEGQVDLPVESMGHIVFSEPFEADAGGNAFPD